MKRYLKENWGALFIILFMVLLILSALELYLGLEDQANNTAVYAFYFLVAGVILQVASYIKYGKGEETEQKVEYKPEAPHPSIKLGRKGKVAVAVIIVSVIVFSSFAIVYMKGPISQVLPHKTYPPLKVYLSINKVLSEPGGTKVVVVGVSSTGGNAPYSFSAIWTDGYMQNSSNPIFQRVFQPGLSLPKNVTIFVYSSDGQKASIVANINANSS